MTKTGIHKKFSPSHLSTEAMLRDSLKDSLRWKRLLTKSEDEVDSESCDEY